MFLDLAYPIIQDSAIVLIAEVIVDWIKHAFITKFNELSASVSIKSLFSRIDKPNRKDILSL